MSRLLTLIVALLILFTIFFIFRDHSKDSKTDLPVSSPSPTVTTTSTEPITSDESKLHEWREFTYEPEHFKVLLPGLPQHVSDTVTDQKTQEPKKYETFAAAGDNGSAFMINAITYSSHEEAEAKEESLKAVVQDMLDRNKENKLNEMKMSTFRNHPALNFSLTNGELLIQGKVFAHKKTMYILSMINNKNAFNKKELDFFINSFDFTEENLEPKTPAKNDTLKYY